MRTKTTTLAIIIGVVLTSVLGLTPANAASSAPAPTFQAGVSSSAALPHGACVLDIPTDAKPVTASNFTCFTDSQKLLDYITGEKVPWTAKQLTGPRVASVLNAFEVKRHARQATSKMTARIAVKNATTADIYYNGTGSTVGWLTYDANYAGDVLAIRGGDGCYDGTSFGVPTMGGTWGYWNNSISSAQGLAGCVAYLYDGENYTSTSKLCGRSPDGCPTLGTFDNLTSSARFVKDPALG